MRRVGVAGLWHETNTFASTPTTLADFRAWHLQRGADVFEAHAGVRDEIGGFCEGARAAGLGLEPWLYAAAVPSGPVERAAYDSLLADLLSQVTADVDGVLLALHGALVVDGLDEAEADLVRRLRRALPPGVPVVATLDFHANPGRGLLDAADVLVGYDTYPHTDAFERAVEATELLVRLIDTGRPPYKGFCKVPLALVPPAQATDTVPMSEVLAEVHACEATPEVATATFCGGFAYSDVPHLGCTALAYSWASPSAAQEAADRIGAAAWERRARFDLQSVPPDRAVARAAEVGAGEGPVVLVDAADNIGGGSPGDGTVLLAELLRQRVRGAVVPVVDAAAVAAAVAAGVGAKVTLEVGGRTDGLHGDPVAMAAQVLGVHDGRYRHTGSYMTGQEVDMGRTAVLRSDGVDVVVSERRVMPFDAEQLRVLGIDPASCSVLVVKSAVAWRAAYGDLAREAVLVDTPGVCTSDLRRLPYTRVRRPLVPLDAEA